MSCWLCEAWGSECDHSDGWHQMILEWRNHWAGPTGWARKQALLQAKRDAKAILTKKKPSKGTA